MGFDPVRFAHALGATCLIVVAIRFGAAQFPTTRARLREAVHRALGGGA